MNLAFLGGMPKLDSNAIKIDTAFGYFQRLHKKNRLKGRKYSGYRKLKAERKRRKK